MGREIINSNILSVETDTNGYQGDDTSPALYVSLIIIHSMISFSGIFV